jgi:hypothetical protein
MAIEFATDASAMATHVLRLSGLVLCAVVALGALGVSTVARTARPRWDGAAVLLVALMVAAVLLDSALVGRRLGAVAVSGLFGIGAAVLFFRSPSTTTRWCAGGVLALSVVAVVLLIFAIDNHCGPGDTYNVPGCA